MRVAPPRDLAPHLDQFGHISVDVIVGREPHERITGANAIPSTVAKFLRDLAEDVERLA